jgi:hypothetical protein
MSIADLKAINWKHFDVRTIPPYIWVSFGIIAIGVLLLIAGLLL